MPRDSGGAYTLPTGNPVAADTLIDSAWANSTLSDLGNEMSNTLHKDGRVSMTGPLVLSTRGTPLDTDAASWINIVNRIQEYFVSLAVRAFRAQTKSANYTALLTDNTTLLNFSATATLSLPAVASIGNGYLLFVTVASGQVLTIDPSGSEQINGVTTATLNRGDFGILLCDGSRWHLMSIQNAADTALVDPVLTRPLMASVRESVANNGAASGNVALDCNAVSTFDLQLTGNISGFTFNNVPTSVAYAMTIRMTQDGTGGRTAAWPASVKWPSAVTPVLSTGAAKTDIITLLTYDGGTIWYGLVAGQDL